MILVLQFRREKSSYYSIKGSKCNPTEDSRRDICGMACWAGDILDPVNTLAHDHNNSD